MMSGDFFSVTASLRRGAGANLDRAYLDRWIRELGLTPQWADLESRLPDDRD
jgi:hypothetical protein